MSSAHGAVLPRAPYLITTLVCAALTPSSSFQAYFPVFLLLPSGRNFRSLDCCPTLKRAATATANVYDSEEWISQGRVLRAKHLDFETNNGGMCFTIVALEIQ